MDAFDYLWRVLGPNVFLTGGVLVLGFVIYWRGWGEARFKSAAEAAGRLAVDEQLKHLQHELDLSLTSAKSALDLDMETAKAGFQRHLSSYSVYAGRRHEAISAMIEEFIAAHNQALEMQVVGDNMEPADYGAALASRVLDARTRAATAYQKSVLYLSVPVQMSTSQTLVAFEELSEAVREMSPGFFQAREQARGLLRRRISELIVHARKSLTEQE